MDEKWRWRAGSRSRAVGRENTSGVRGERAVTATAQTALWSGKFSFHHGASLSRNSSKSGSVRSAKPPWQVRCEETSVPYWRWMAAPVDCFVHKWTETKNLMIFNYLGRKKESGLTPNTVRSLGHRLSKNAAQGFTEGKMQVQKYCAINYHFSEVTHTSARKTFGGSIWWKRHPDISLPVQWRNASPGT